MRHTEWKGTHDQMGLQQGAAMLACGQRILEHIPFEITPERLAYGQACIPVYQKYQPEALEELAGLAAGQQTDVQTLGAVLFSMYAIPPACFCSCFAAASEDGVVFGRNSDFLTALEAWNTNTIYRPRNGWAFMGHTTSFIQMEDGVNQWGLAVGLTSVAPSSPLRPGLNAGMLVRYLLEHCKTVSEALARLEELPLGSSQTLTLADRSGALAVHESNSDRKAVYIPPVDGLHFVCATNRFHLPAMASYDPGPVDDWFAERRYQTMYKALRSPCARADTAFARNLLSGGYGFLCQYDRATGKDTVWSVVYDLRQGEIWRSEGNPRRCGYHADRRFAIDG